MLLTESGHVLSSANQKCQRLRKAKMFFLVIIISFVMLGLPRIDAAIGFPHTSAGIEILVVSNDGTGNFSSIQEAINNATQGGVVYVQNGTYYEHVMLNKSLSLIGESWAGTVIDGSGYGTDIQVSVNDTKVSGFTMQNCTSGITLIGCYHCNISLNAIKMNIRGVYIEDSYQNILCGNNLTNDDFPVTLQRSDDNIICANLLEHNYSPGISLYHGNNNTIHENIVRDNPAYGVYLENCENNTIDKNEIAYVCEGIHVNLSHYNTIMGNNVTKTGPYAIYLEYSDHNSIKRNSLEDNEIALQLSSSCYNILDENRIIANKWGLYLWLSGDNNVTNNNMTANLWSFGVFGQELGHFINDVDVTNLIDGRPVYYWIREHGREVPQNAGYVAIINSTDIYVRNLSLTNNYQGVLLAYSNNSVLYNLRVSDNFYGLWLFKSFNNTITGCTLQDNINGEYLKESNYNLIYNDNFVHENKLEISGTVNSWDNNYPDGGNYWSDYTGPDEFGGLYQNLTGSDGIGDTPYAIDAFNRDRFPLMDPLSVFDAGEWNGVSYHIDIVSNSAISGFRFNPLEGSFVCFNVTESEGAIGFCRVKIPKNLLWAEDQDWQVYLSDGQQLIPALVSNQEYTYLYFTYVNSLEMIKIQGTNEIPEFLNSIAVTILFFFMTYVIILVKGTYKEKVLAKT
jgi:parallel beta-helix repeat protein